VVRLTFNNTIKTISDAWTASGTKTYIKTYTENGHETVYFTDTVGYTGSVDVNVQHIDRTAPELTLIGTAEVQLHVGSAPFSDPGAIREDNGLTGIVYGTGEIDYNTLNDYTLTYTKADAAGNTTTVTRTISIIDDSMPDVELLGDPEISINIFSTWTDPGAVWKDNGLTGWIQGTGIIDTGAVGAYTLLYTYTDPAGNSAS
jgi:hypothetical protein